MNPASVKALEQARGIFREGATVAVKRIRELRQALKEAEHQLAHAEEQLAQIDEDLKALETEGDEETSRAETARDVLGWVQPALPDHWYRDARKQFGVDDLPSDDSTAQESPRPVGVHYADSIGSDA